MRCLAPLLVTCLLLAGAAPRHAVQPCQDDAIAAAKALVKLAVRRTDGARPVGKLELDPIALPNVRSLDVPRLARVVARHATPLTRARVTALRVRARGPPVG